jgi:hypothetical protein
MSETEDPMVEFLASLGIERDRDYCEHCGAPWPYCRWASIIDEPPCSEIAPTNTGEKPS